MLTVILVGADARSQLLKLEALARRVRIGLKGWLAGLAGLKVAEGLIILARDPRILAALLAITGTLVGLVAAGWHRVALACGFGAAEADRPDAIFVTIRGWQAAPLILCLMRWFRPMDPASLLTRSPFGSLPDSRQWVSSQLRSGGPRGSACAAFRPPDETWR